MNRRVLIFSLIAILLLPMVIWWWSRLSLPQSSAVTTVQSPTSSSAQVQNQNYPWQGHTYVPLPADREPGYNPSLPQWAEWERREELDPKFEWKMPINFYGKVIDQNGQPVPGAKVRFQWTDMSKTGTTEKFTESNAQGVFTLTNERGKNLGIYVSKDGYHAIGKGRKSFEYAAFFEPDYIEPDPNSPVIFHLLKKIEAEPLLVRSALKRVSYEGVYYYDVQSGTISQQSPSPGGIKFSFTRSQAAQGKPFDWTWKVEGINLTMQATTDEFPQLAPIEDYAPSWEIEQKSDAKDFQRQAKVRLYLRTESRRHYYGRVDLELSHPNARDLGPVIKIESYFNPTPDSRSLEFDPAKAL